MAWECDTSGDEEKDYRFWLGSLIIEDRHEKEDNTEMYLDGRRIGDVD